MPSYSLKDLERAGEILASAGAADVLRFVKLVEDSAEEFRTFSKGVKRTERSKLKFFVHNASKDMVLRVLSQIKADFGLDGLRSLAKDQDVMSFGVRGLEDADAWNPYGGDRAAVAKNELDDVKV